VGKGREKRGRKAGNGRGEIKGWSERGGDENLTHCSFFFNLSSVGIGYLCN